MTPFGGPERNDIRVLGLTICIGLLTPFVMAEVMEFMLARSPTLGILGSIESLNAATIMALFYAEKAVVPFVEALAFGVALGILWDSEGDEPRLRSRASK